MADKSPVIEHLTDRTRFGTQTRLAQAAGVKPHTISGKAAGDNPLTYTQMRRVLQAAPSMGVAIDAWDFFPEEAEARLRDAAA